MKPRLIDHRMWCFRCSEVEVGSDKRSCPTHIDTRRPAKALALLVTGLIALRPRARAGVTSSVYRRAVTGKRHVEDVVIRLSNALDAAMPGSLDNGHTR